MSYGRRVNLVYIFQFLTLEFTQFTVSPELVLKSIHVMWGWGGGVTPLRPMPLEVMDSQKVYWYVYALGFKTDIYVYS